MTVRGRDAYRDIELYEPGRISVEIDLSDNTNLFGMAPSVRELLASAPDRWITRYPSVWAKELKAALARYHGVAVENIVTGCGSDDVIDSALRAFCDPGDRVVHPAPTFGVVGTFAKMNAASVLPVAMDATFSFATSEVVDAAGRVTYICSPNNPTGTSVSAAQVRELDRRLDGLLLLDEAYADFAQSDHAQFAATSDRTVSLRTFSKAFGLAGMRVGYAVGPAAVIGEIEKSRGPYKVGGLAEALALNALQERAWVAQTIAQTRENRTRLAEALDRLGLRFVESAANFILLQLPAGSIAVSVNDELRRHGVSARPFANVPHAGECLRVTVGPWPLMRRFIDALRLVLNP